MIFRDLSQIVTMFFDIARISVEKEVTALAPPKNRLYEFELIGSISSI